MARLPHEYKLDFKNATAELGKSDEILIRETFLSSLDPALKMIVSAHCSDTQDLDSLVESATRIERN